MPIDAATGTEWLVVEGVTELRSALKSIKADLTDPMMKKALQAGAIIIRNATMDAAPMAKTEYTYGGKTITPFEYPYRGETRQPPGTLRKAIVVKSTFDRSTGEWVFFSGVTGGKGATYDAFYARFLELDPLNRPFMSRAFEGSKGAAVAKVAAVLRQGAQSHGKM